MRLLYHHRTRSADGQYVHIASLTNAISAAGHELTVCGPDGVSAVHATPARRMDAGSGAKRGIIAHLPKAFYELAELAYSVPAYWRLKRAARAENPNIIYERYNLYFLAGLWLRQQTRLPLILEVNAPLRRERMRHHGLALSNLARWAERKVWRGADAVLPVTQVLADELVAEGVAPEKIHVIANGVQLGDFDDANGDAVRRKYALRDKIVLGFTGFVRDWHGVDTILDYLAARHDGRLHLMIVGDGPHLLALHARAVELGIEPQVTFTGVIQRALIPDHIAAFDIALQPRVTEYASPLKLFEYMALGKAILAPAQPNIEEILTDAENAVLFQPDERNALFAALDILTRDPSIRATLGACARRTIIDRDLTWEGNAARVLKIAEELIDKREESHASHCAKT